MDKPQLLDAIEREWETLQQAIDGLNDEQLTRAPFSGEWTVKDALAHIAVWQSRLITDLYKIERGLTPETGLTNEQVDRLNDRYYREQKDRPLERVIEDLYGGHLALLSRVEKLPAAALSSPGRYRWLRGRPLSAWIAEDSFEHYLEHAAEIAAWRKAALET